MENLSKARYQINGRASDGKIFTVNSKEVIEYMNKFPDVSPETSIGSAVREYEKNLPDEHKPVEAEQAEDEEDDDETEKKKIQDSDICVGEDRGEVMANITLTYRHLEDAKMRLEKVIQAVEGQSPYDQ